MNIHFRQVATLNRKSIGRCYIYSYWLGLRTAWAFGFLTHYSKRWLQSRIWNAHAFQKHLQHGIAESTSQLDALALNADFAFPPDCGIIEMAKAIWIHTMKISQRRPLLCSSLSKQIRSSYGVSSSLRSEFSDWRRRHRSKLFAQMMIYADCWNTGGWASKKWKLSCEFFTEGLASKPLQNHIVAPSQIMVAGRGINVILCIPSGCVVCGQVIQEMESLGATSDENHQ